MNVLINHPNFGSLWLLDAKIKGKYVIGDVWDESGIGSPYLPDTWIGEFNTMNFPITCIRKTEK